MQQITQVTHLLARFLDNTQVVFIHSIDIRYCQRNNYDEVNNGYY